MREPRALPTLALFASLLAACGDDAPAASRTPGDREVAAMDPGVDPSPVTTSCAQDLEAQTPAPVRAMLGDLGYPGLFDDVCAAQRAEETGDASLCAPLTASSARDRCVVRVAIAAGHPADCPTARTVDGRDPLCVALAARDRRLCAAAGLLDGAICQSALGRAGACGHLPEIERAECTSRATDLATRVTGTPRTSPPLETSLTITQRDAARSLTTADRGARLVYRGCTRALIVGDPHRLTAPFGTASLALDAVLPDREAPLEVRLSGMATDASSTLLVSLDGIRTLHATDGTVSISELEPELGGRVVATLEASFAGQSPITGTLSTFLRDVDPRPANCAAPQ